MGIRTDHLALPQWSLGQVLLPEHFQVQERAILGQIATRQRYGQVQQHGVASLEIDETLLAAGTFAMPTATILFPHGLLLDIPGNCTAQNLQLATMQGDRVELFVHVFSRQVASLQWRDPERAAAFAEHPSPERVVRDTMRLELWTSPQCEQAIESMKLVELQRDRNGQWRLASYCPPVVALGTTPFLRDSLRQTAHVVDLAVARATAALVDNSLCGEEVWAARTVIASVCEVRSILAEVEAGVAHHPHHLFAALRRLALHVHAWQGTDLSDTLFPYLHHDLERCFVALLEPMQAALLRTAPLPRKILHFVLQDRVWIADPFPDALRRAKHVYLALERHEGRPIALTRLKLAAPSRLAFLHDYALPGVELQACPAPDIVLPSRGNLDFYLLDAGAEWSLAVQEGAIGFHCAGLPSTLRATMCWGGET